MQRSRPLSPHVTAYRINLFSFLSMAHRLSGLYAYLFTIVLSWRLVFWAMCSDCASNSKNVSIIFLIFLFAYTQAIIYHMFNGMRHFMWDALKLFNLKHGWYSGVFIFLFAIIVNFILWFCF